MRVLATVLVVAACGSSNKPPAGPPAAETAAPTAETQVQQPAPGSASGSNDVRVTLADAGLEAASLDRSADPCGDFYQFACGGWLQTNQIPPDRARWARFTELDEKNKATLRGLLEDDAKGIGTDAVGKKLGDFYAACMDAAAIEKAGASGIAPLRAIVDKVRDAKSWQAAIEELHRNGIDVVWGVSSSPDFKDSMNQVTVLDTGGLGLPDRDYYFKPELAPKLEAYRTHVGKMLALGGVTDAGAAGDVIAIETELAKLTKTRVDRRDPKAMYNATDATALAKTVKSFDWKAYWKALDFTPSKKIIVTTPPWFAAVDTLRGKFKPAQWRNYLTYHLLNHASFTLPKAFDDEAFELTRVLTGQPERADRSKRCIDATSTALGELLGEQYVAKAFPGASKQTATTLVDAIMTSMHDDLEHVDWMSDHTREIALGKLAKVVRKIGYPDKWRTYDFDVKRDDFAGDTLRAGAFAQHYVDAKSGKPVDRAEWGMNTYTVNAYYEPTENNTALPAGILQPPFFGQDRSIAANLGGVGMVIGHELTHGFDDEGAQFDADGNMVNWWAAADKDKFDAKGKCVADEYGSFEALPKQFVNGRLTLGEDIADLGGVKMAFHAYRALRKDAAKHYVADGFTEDQQFFLAVGQAWCSKDRNEEIERRLTVDPHAPPKFRVYGALRNLPEFAEAFSCSVGTPMRPANTCSVW
jgi:putative endopeptidase